MVQGSSPPLASSPAAEVGGGPWSLYDLASYPFLPGVQERLEVEGVTLTNLAQDPLHAGARSLGLERLEAALRGEALNLPAPASDREAREVLLSYVWARILLAGLVAQVSRTKRKTKGRPGREKESDKAGSAAGLAVEGRAPLASAQVGLMAVRYFALAEALAAQNRLVRAAEADPRRLLRLAEALGLRLGRVRGGVAAPSAEEAALLSLTPAEDAAGESTSPLELRLAGGGRGRRPEVPGGEAVGEGYRLHFADYIRASAALREGSWKLVNQPLERGWVRLSQRRLVRLLREVVRERLEQGLPTLEDPEVLEQLKPDLMRLARILTARQARAASQGVGKLSLAKAPPCLKSLLEQLAGGVNVPHLGRFTLTAFLHGVGMDNQQIMNLYATAPDFSAERTRYQVEHVLGMSSPTEYDTPGCDHLKTNGLCVDPDSLCQAIHHPLEYYRVMGESEKPVQVRLERELLATLTIDGQAPAAAFKGLFVANRPLFASLLTGLPRELPPLATLVEARRSPAIPYRLRVRVGRFNSFWRRENHPLTTGTESLSFGVARLIDAEGEGELTTTAILDWETGRYLASRAGSSRKVELVGQALTVKLGEGRNLTRLHIVGCVGQKRVGSALKRV